MTEEEFLAWYDNASPEEIAEHEKWLNDIDRWAKEAYSKAGVIGKHIPTNDDPWELASIYEAIVSHHASTIPRKKTHPRRDKAQQIGAQEKLIDSSDYVKRVWRMDEFKDIPWNTFKDWFK